MEKQYKVYKIINDLNVIEYVGMTERTLKDRFYLHTYRTGKFYNRQDVNIHLVIEFDTKREALNLEKLLQTKYGFKTNSDYGRISANNNIKNGIFKDNGKKAWLKNPEGMLIAAKRNVKKATCAAKNISNNQKWLCPGPEKHISSGACFKNWCVFRSRDPNKAIRLI